jgi:hypothetical protein
MKTRPMIFSRTSPLASVDATKLHARRHTRGAPQHLLYSMPGVSCSCCGLTLALATLSASCGVMQPRLTPSASDQTREFRTLPCSIPWRDYTLTWRAIVQASDAEMVSYKISYTFKGPNDRDPYALKVHSQNGETIAYFGGSWTPLAKVNFGQSTKRIIPPSIKVYAPPSKDFLEGVIYIEGTFDVPGEDVECNEAVDLRVGTSRITYPYLGD